MRVDSLSSGHWGLRVQSAARGALITPARDGTYTLDVYGLPVEVSEQGAGPSLLFLHAGYPSSGPESSAAILDKLTKSFRVIAPTHPGFGHVDAPGWITSVDDLAYLYLDMLRLLDVSDVMLVGASFGGWIAAEMCVRSTERVARLVLANPLGIKTGDRQDRDIVDIFGILDSELAERAYADSSFGDRDPKELSEDELFYLARSREATARYAWSPFMHDPKLLRRLRRIDVATLVLWGQEDRVVSDAYVPAFAAAIADAVVTAVEAAGHFPTIEQPELCAAHIAAFQTNPVEAARR